ncbi:hypothetical protein EJ06DRAFT_534322 [Trichodelitschia bisporula]|uniref:Sodium/calcium exchanger membrane region domain-containing protein n=1 Tax=Trichodelitschia bisporula TaxID=703511 RepID=A0A6G1HJK2_9PEZI|nr:hypothetical protein EJ06DRAFT_534322 [Trichodelitschia bisporula]
MHRLRSWATSTHASRSKPAQPILPTSASPLSQDSQDDHHSSPRPTASQHRRNVPVKSGALNEKASIHSGGDPAIQVTQDAGEKSASVDQQAEAQKPPLSIRFKTGAKRFVSHTKAALLHSYVNLLLIFVPIGIAVNAIHLSPAIIFSMNAVAIVPLAGLLSFATESVAMRSGDAIGALLNVSFGNAVELIIFIALVKNEIRIVQASLLGSILANLLLILGMAFLFGGLRFQEQLYNNTVTQMSACLLSLSVMSLLLPTAFHASFSANDVADRATLKISRGTSVVLLLVYGLFLLFQLKSHAYLYSSVPRERIDEESQPGFLADMLDSSSSSSSSDSSSDDSGTSSDSHTTAKRIKRAFRNRKRRKSSASSKDGQSVLSHVSSPSVEAHPVFQPSPPMSNMSRQGSVLGAIRSDEEHGNGRGSRGVNVRDFENATVGESSRSPERALSPELKQKKTTKKSRKHHHRHHHHRHNHGKNKKEAVVEEPSEEVQVIGASGKLPERAGSQPRVGFVDDVDLAQEIPNSRRPIFRPALPKLLSQNVFISPPPLTAGSLSRQSTASRATDPQLRRTSSMPERLNGVYSTLGARPFPPFVAGARVKTPERGGETDEQEESLEMSRTAAITMLLVTTALVAVCAEFLVDAIPEMIEESSVSQAFIGLIILPIVGNAAEHITAVSMATKNKMDLAIGIAVGSSIQIALFMTPLVVILGWCMNRAMTLYFNLFETVSLFVTAFVVNFLVLDGKSNYLEGTLLISAYVIIALAAFFYPDSTQQSLLGGSSEAHNATVVARALKFLA